MPSFQTASCRRSSFSARIGPNNCSEPDSRHCHPLASHVGKAGQSRARIGLTLNTPPRRTCTWICDELAIGHRQTHRRTGILPHTWDMRPEAQHHPIHAWPQKLTVMLVASSAVPSALLAKRIDQHTRTTRQATRHNETTPFEHGLTTPSKQGNRTQQMDQKPTVHAGIHLGSPRALCK